MRLERRMECRFASLHSCLIITAVLVFRHNLSSPKIVTISPKYLQKGALEIQDWKMQNRKTLDRKMCSVINWKIHKFIKSHVETKHMDTRRGCPSSVIPDATPTTRCHHIRYLGPTRFLSYTNYLDVMRRFSKIFVGVNADWLRRVHSRRTSSVRLLWTFLYIQLFEEISDFRVLSIFSLSMKRISLYHNSNWTYCIAFERLYRINLFW